MATPNRQLSHPKYRPDIDGLRAVAVLSVIAFHAFPAWIDGGFIGVDIFFVISGFLISTIIFENLDSGTFSFATFYARRIKRIFPALLLVLATSFATGWFALLADEYKQLGKHIAAGAGFVSNLVLWHEAGYFDNSAETKPLLHLWSLGVEEQFYIAWPLLLWLAWKLKFNFLTTSLLVAFLSFYLNAEGITKDKIATFYSPQTRFWELLCGSILAWTVLYKKRVLSSIKIKLEGWVASVSPLNKTDGDDSIIPNLVSLLGLFSLAFGFWKINKDANFPGNLAILPVISAVLIILAGQKAWVNQYILANKIAIWFGLISFPLYLWHWPILSFVRIIAGEYPSISIRISALITSVIFAWLTYQCVERPVRSSGNEKHKVSALLVLMLTMTSLGYATYRSDGFLKNRYDESDQSLVKALLPEYSSKYTWKRFNELTHATFSDQDFRKKILIVGDSYAEDLVNAIYASSLNERFQIITRHIRKECGNLYIKQDFFLKEIPPNLLDECKHASIFEDNGLRENMLRSDEIWLASAWQNWQLNFIADSIQNVAHLTNRPVRVFGRKHLGKINPRELLKIDGDDRHNHINAVPEMQTKINEHMRQILSPEVFINVQALLCGDQPEECHPFDKDNLLKSYDGTHLTQEGARIYGAGLIRTQIAQDSQKWNFQ